MSEREKEIARIERSRRQKEDELLLLLLLWSDRARRTAVTAARLGHDPADAIRQVLVGNDHFEGVAPAIAQYMTSAHVSAYRRVARTVGVALPAEASVLYEPGLYDAAAADAAERMVTVLVGKWRDAMQEGQSTVDAVRTAFNSGASRVDSSYLDTVSTMNVLRGWNAGSWQAMHAEDISPLITGFEHVSVMDSGTTAICAERNGLKLPPSDIYWQRGWPSLHWDCRSVVLPILGDFTPSDWRPTVPPMAGFGYPPTWGVAGMAA